MDHCGTRPTTIMKVPMVQNGMKELKNETSHTARIGFFLSCGRQQTAGYYESSKQYRTLCGQWKGSGSTRQRQWKHKAKAVS